MRSELPDLCLSVAQLLVQLGVLAVQVQAFVQSVEKLAPNAHDQGQQLGMPELLADLIGVSHFIENARQMKTLNLVRHVPLG